MSKIFTSTIDHTNKIFTSIVDHTKFFLSLWLHRPPFKNHTVLLLLSCISLLYSSHGFHFHHPEILRLSNPPLPPPPPPPLSPAPFTSPTKFQTPISVVGAPLFLSLPPLSPALSTSPTKSQTQISVADASSAKVEIWECEIWAKGKGERGGWGVGKIKVGSVIY